MNSKAVLWSVGRVAAFFVTVWILVAAASALAEPPMPKHLRGVINDYTPSTAVMPAGPWEIRGPWRLRFEEKPGKADFSAALTMELSDPADVNDPSTRMQHTHHLTVEDGVVTQIKDGFEVKGAVTITKDGGDAPKTLQGSTLVIDITGGKDVAFSNITLTFLGGATIHFGSQEIHGVVRRVDSAEEAKEQEQ